MSTILEGQLLASEGTRVGIVVARFNESITEKLLEGALDGLRRGGVASENVTIARVPGSFEIPLVARKLAERGTFDVLICLGCVIKGETRHFDYVAGGAAQGIARVSLESGLPVIFAVLTTETADQARDRAGLKMNRGREAAAEAIEMANLMRQLGDAGQPAGS